MVFLIHKRLHNFTGLNICSSVCRYLSKKATGQEYFPVLAIITCCLSLYTSVLTFQYKSRNMHQNSISDIYSKIHVFLKKNLNNKAHIMQLFLNFQRTFLRSKFAYQLLINDRRYLLFPLEWTRDLP
jgi:hypothetical protein